MASFTSMVRTRRPARQIIGRNQDRLMVCRALQEEIWRLNDLLAWERAKCCREQNWRIQLCQELDQTKQQLAHQKSLKEMYINREKETRGELERVQKYSNPETLSTTKIATQVRDNIKRKKKKLLQIDYEELQVAHIISEEKFMAELQEEREKNKVLQEEVEGLKASHQVARRRYEADVLTVRQQAENLQRELEKEIKAHADRVARDQLLVETLAAERDVLRQQMAEEMRLKQQHAAEQDMIWQRELEELKTQLIAQVSLNLELSSKLKAEREDNQPPQPNISTPQERHGEKQENKPADRHQTPARHVQEVTLPNALPDPIPMETEVYEEILYQKAEKASVWARTRKLLGLRKQ